ncbi:DUF4230 domain-containing protein [Planococcus lenghuensis]|uniref:DUF4230 domain-containing protein n=1 Tax=Planococcus lenghuensis TaxID=2213202 RepID=A0A1Q2L1N8_9BACL|nr:DUF4230 domain-containing protein [Planococcus lenghuensis]AQQ54333.1 hypothetical protein B0X71_15325 [Planococcus lenghuensis]
MSDDERYKEIERQLNEVKDREKEGRRGRPKSSWRNWIFLISVLIVLLAAALPFGVFWYLQSGNTFQESQSSIVERLQDLNELSTAEAYTKVIIEQDDNQLFGRDIGFDVPGTDRQLLVVIPGKVRAGVDFSSIAADDITVDEEAQTAILLLPEPKLLGEPELMLKDIKIYSHEGMFRGDPDLSEAYTLAEEAQKLMKKEAEAQGVLQLAEDNASRSVRDMFGLVGYDVTVRFK